METVRVQRVIRVGTSLAVVLPADICRSLKIEKGDSISFGVFESDTVVVRKLSANDLRSLRPEIIFYGDTKNN